MKLDGTTPLWLSPYLHLPSTSTLAQGSQKDSHRFCGSPGPLPLAHHSASHPSRIQWLCRLRELGAGLEPREAALVLHRLRPGLRKLRPGLRARLARGSGLARGGRVVPAVLGSPLHLENEHDVEGSQATWWGWGGFPVSHQEGYLDVTSMDPA